MLQIPWLVTRRSYCLNNSEVNVTSDGHSYLGTSYIQSKKVQVWSKDVKQLSKIAEAVYCVFTHRRFSQCLFICHTVPGILSYLQPLDNVIGQVFIPTITGCSPPSDSIHKLFCFPARWDDLGPSFICDSEFAVSHNICEPLCIFISNHSLCFTEVSASQLKEIFNLPVEG